MTKSRQYKRNKYRDLSSDLKINFAGMQIIVESIEVSSLGFISDTSKFTSNTTGQPMPVYLMNEITKSVISSS